MLELKEKRQYISKTFDNEDGTKTININSGHIHYRNTANEMTDVDFTLEDKGTYWQMTKASYKIFIAKDFGADDLIRFDNVYRGANHKIYYEPKMLAWVNNQDMSDMQIFRSQQSVQGEITDKNVIRYTNAFGDGIHFEITIMSSGFTKEIVIDAKNKLELPPTAEHKLVALFRYKGEGLKIKSNDKLREWDKDGWFEERDGFRIQEDNEVYQSFIRPAIIIDNASNIESIKVFWKLHNGALWQAKVLNKGFLLNAEYPVRADTTTEYNNNAGGTGRAYPNVAGQPTQETWDTAHDATTAGTATAQLNNIGALMNGGLNRILLIRGFISIDTNALPAGATVSAATLYIKPLTYDNDWNDAYAYFNIVESTQASPTAVTTADFDQCGSVNNPTLLSDTDATMSTIISDISGASYTSWVFNSSGLSAINTDDYSTFGIREGRDIEDIFSDPGEADKNSTVQFDTVTNKPYLSVTYTEGGAGFAYSQAVIIN